MYSGFVKQASQSRANTVVAGHQEDAQKEANSEQGNTPTQATSMLFVPYADKAQRIQYLAACKAYLQNQLDIVTQQLNLEV